MQYFSLQNPDHRVPFGEAVLNGLAPDKGLYFPQEIVPLPASFWDALPDLSDAEIGIQVLRQFVAGEIADEALSELVAKALSFPFPLVQLSESVWTLELFHGPTLAFKDVGARCMGRILGFCADPTRETVVLVATSGDTGSAVAHGLLGVEGVRVVVLYPKGKVSALQERQMATLGGNVSAIAVDGVFDDCQALVKRAFVDNQLKDRLQITSANSINIARWLPQAIYYIVAARDWQAVHQEPPVICVPSGNYGNLSAGVVAERMGMPVKRWVAASNANDVVPEYLTTGLYRPRPSVQTLSNAMDVGDPSNFTRLLELYKGDYSQFSQRVTGKAIPDYVVLETIRSVAAEHDYLLDPHGATGFAALEQSLEPGEHGFFLETAHPAKFGHVYDLINMQVAVPERLARFQDAVLLSIEMPNDYEAFREYLIAGS